MREGNLQAVAQFCDIFYERLRESSFQLSTDSVSFESALFKARAVTNIIAAVQQWPPFLLRQAAGLFVWQQV